MSGWLTAVSAGVTVLALVALGLREWVAVRRGPGGVARRLDAAVVLVVVAFAALMALRLSSGG